MRLRKTFASLSLASLSVSLTFREAGSACKYARSAKLSRTKFGFFTFQLRCPVFKQSFRQRNTARQLPEQPLDGIGVSGDKKNLFAFFLKLNHHSRRQAITLAQGSGNDNPAFRGHLRLHKF